MKKKVCFLQLMRYGWKKNESDTALKEKKRKKESENLISS